MEVKIKHEDRTIKELSRYNIPFSYDSEDGTGNISVMLKDITKDAITPLSELIMPLIPMLNSRPIFIRHHHSIYDIPICNLKQDMMNILCFYGYGNASSSIKGTLKYPFLRWNKKECRNAYGQEDCLIYKENPGYAIAVKDDKGETVAFLGYHVISINFDILHCHLNDLHVKFISDLVRLYLKMENRLKELLYEYAVTKTRAEFVEYVKRRYTQSIYDCESQINALQLEIEEYSEKIDKNYRQLIEHNTFLEAAKMAVPDYEGEVEKLISLYSIDFTESGEMIIHTDDIEIEGIIIGKFDISIDTVNNRIQVENITRKAGLFDHPHVKKGNMCFGKLRSDISKLIAEGKLLEVANMVSGLLYFYNPSGAYKSIEEWERWEELWGPGGSQVGD